MSINILSLHSTVLSRIEKEEIINHERLELIESLLTTMNENVEMCDELRLVRNAIQQDASKEMFMAKTFLIIDEYSKILKSPISHKRENCLPVLRRKHELMVSYLNITHNLVKAKGWTDMSIPTVGTFHDNETRPSCPGCDNNDENNFETDEYNRRVCLVCSTQFSPIETGFTQKDFSRVNIVGKFIYNRVLHFQDCIKQYQGKQNCRIPASVYQDLDQKFSAYRLLIDSPVNQIKYSKITRNHIMMFLKELKYTKHYENVNLIYFTLTGKRIDDIAHLEDQLVEDFKELILLYDDLHGKDKPEELDRKNFMNVQYLLFQLLKRHGHACKIEDFTILKTVDRKLFHDTICKNLFDKLGWRFTPTF